MSVVTIVIERANNNLSAYIKGIEGIAATGKSIREIKQSMHNAISAYIETCKEFGMEIPDELSGKYLERRLQLRLRGHHN